jgi:hypothetical protein
VEAPLTTHFFAYLFEMICKNLSILSCDNGIDLSTENTNSVLREYTPPVELDATIERGLSAHGDDNACVT